MEKCARNFAYTAGALRICVIPPEPKIPVSSLVNSPLCGVLPPTLEKTALREILLLEEIQG
jgi:hypothetical protein